MARRSDWFGAGGATAVALFLSADGALAVPPPGDPALELAAPVGRRAEERIAIDFNGLDWDSAGALTFEVVNRSEAPLAFRVELVGAGLQGRARIDAGGHARFQVGLPAGRGAFPGLKRGPKRDGHRNFQAVPMKGGGGADAAPPGEALFVILPSPVDARLAVSRPQLVPPLSPVGMVDRFGQHAGADWPGKARTEADLARRDELPTLEVGKYDTFLGWRGGARFEGTGYFRAAKEGGRHWLVTPEGHRFFSLGVNTIRNDAVEQVAGREDWFQWLPGDRRRLAKDGVGFYGINLQRKFGDDFEERWLGDAIERLRAWGFNTMANWSDERLAALRRMPFTARINPVGDYPLYRAGFATKHGVPDPFSPAFLDALERAASDVAPALADNPWLLGYFVHNELDWGRWDSDKGRVALARAVFAARKPTPAKAAFRKFLEQKYATPEALAQAWGLDIASWEVIEGARLDIPANPPADSALRGDLLALTRLLAGEYFRVVRGTIRRHDPNHLYLGTRFAAWWCTPEVLDAAAAHCDVISVNDYSPRIDPGDTFWAHVGSLDKPAMVSEFHFGATDRGSFHGGLEWVGGQEARAESYERFVTSAAATGFIVGCHWFQYVDQPLTGRMGDGENYGIGLVTVVDLPHRELTQSMSRVHRGLYSLIDNDEPGASGSSAREAASP